MPGVPESCPDFAAGRNLAPALIAWPVPDPVMTKKKASLGGFIISLFISLFMAGLYLGHPRLMEVMELKVFDLHFRWRGRVSAGPEVVIAAIDQKSIDELGRWPWHRSRMKSLVEELSRCGAKTVAFDITFPSPEMDLPSSEEYAFELLKGLTGSESAVSRQRIRQVLTRLDPDRDFGQALLKAGNTILGMFFFLSKEEVPKGQSMQSSPPFIASQRYPLVQKMDPEDTMASEDSANGRIPRGYGFESSLGILAESALANGFFNMYPDFDGIIRWAPLIIEYQGDYYPSLDMQVIRHYFGLTEDSLLIQMRGAGVESLLLEGIPVPVDERGHLLINYRGPHDTYPHYSICDILARRIPAENLRDKIVLVGATATGIYDMRYTPYKIMAGVEIHANILDSLLHLDFLSLPDHYFLIDLCILLLIGFLLGTFLSLTRPLTGLSLTACLLAGYAGFNQYLFTSRGIWINLVYPSAEIMIIFTLINLYRYITEEREKKRIKNSFECYLAPALVNELIQNPQMLRLGGERKLLTVLFSDIRGFTSISERMEPEALVSFLNEYMSIMSTIVLNYAGFLDKFIGDAIMAVYCAPLFREDHARLACQTALDMRGALLDINAGFQQKNLPHIRIGIGINSGDMIVGNMGSRQRMDYTVLGDNVNLASRLEGITKVYGVDIVISESTCQFVRNEFVVRELDRVRVKGKIQPVKIYELMGRVEDSSQLEPLLKGYHAGLNAYLNQRWEEGMEHFHQVLQAYPSDGPSKYYLDRCRQYLVSPPAPEWDGVLNLTAK
ncbi:MAG: adenylate/guanylate cyclase domain-containing protein [bacterium]